MEDKRQKTGRIAKTRAPTPKARQARARQLKAAKEEFRKIICKAAFQIPPSTSKLRTGVDPVVKSNLHSMRKPKIIGPEMLDDPEAVIGVLPVADGERMVAEEEPEPICKRQGCKYPIRRFRISRDPFPINGYFKTKEVIMCAAPLCTELPLDCIDVLVPTQDKYDTMLKITDGKEELGGDPNVVTGAPPGAPVKPMFTSMIRKDMNPFNIPAAKNPDMDIVNKSMAKFKADGYRMPKTKKIAPKCVEESLWRMLKVDIRAPYTPPPPPRPAAAATASTSTTAAASNEDTNENEEFDKDEEDEQLRDFFDN